ncbi:MAG: sigma-54 dependent transcriptional regulator [Thiohalocapsa sp.]|nr:sigma-54 dependent transcriptional regulator [Thiohalocapsa sp.]MCF7989510.1 sigma-54 dependent transcriptional regulator [Thiohalocapsa sp.]
MSQAKALIIDDEADILELVTITCTRMNVAARSAATVQEAKHLLETERFDLCLTDMRLPDGNGIDLVRLIGEKYPQTPVAVITAYGSMESAVSAMKAGAFDFVSKPLELQILRDLIGASLRLRTSVDAADKGETRSGLLGTSPQMARIRELIAKLARNQAPVFITGESGTGKELAARLIHAQGPRADRPFVPVNCGAIPDDLVESELFGHRKGSFTGAVSDKQGLFQAANGGTLFLDEIADLPLPTQVKLLRAIQQKSVRPVGAEHEIPVDVRIISASHADLKTAVENGTFRQDLYYRINVIDLLIPPLRERPEDIDVLAGHILARIAEATGTRPKALSEEAAAALRAHDFPGNVRELENILERATALGDDTSLGVEELRLPPHGDAPAPHPASGPVAATAAAGEHTPPAEPEVDVASGQPLEDALDEIERKAILKALDATRWNRTAAAKLLGMTPRSLRYRLSKLGLD